jgi:hypothetical protein
MEAFEQSKKKRVTTIQDDGQGDGRGGSMIKMEETAGDHGFLNVAKNSMVEQARLLGLHELKREENQDKSYRQFLQDLSKTIDKEKEVQIADSARDNAVEVSFDVSEPPELGPGGIPLQSLPKDDY